MFACSMGCKTPTIDSVLPYRSHLYGEGGRGNWTGVDIILGPSIDNALSSLFNTVFSLDTEPVIFDDLSEHAENMEILMVPYLRSDITILTSDVSLWLQNPMVPCICNAIVYLGSVHLQRIQL